MEEKFNLWFILDLTVRVFALLALVPIIANYYQDPWQPILIFLFILWAFRPVWLVFKETGFKKKLKIIYVMKKLKKFFSFPKDHFKNKFRDLREMLKYPLGIFIEGLAEALILIIAVLTAIIYNDNILALFSLKRTIIPLIIVFFILLLIRSSGRMIQESMWRKNE